MFINRRNDLDELERYQRERELKVSRNNQDAGYDYDNKRKKRNEKVIVAFAVVSVVAIGLILSSLMAPTRKTEEVSSKPVQQVEQVARTVDNVNENKMDYSADVIVPETPETKSVVSDSDIAEPPIKPEAPIAKKPDPSPTPRPTLTDPTPTLDPTSQSMLKALDEGTEADWKEELTPEERAAICDESIREYEDYIRRKKGAILIYETCILELEEEKYSILYPERTEEQQAEYDELSIQLADKEKELRAYMDEYPEVFTPNPNPGSTNSKPH